MSRQASNIKVSGQLLMRHQGEKDGRTLFMVVGLIAVPPGQEWKDGHQYTVMGLANDQLYLDTDAPIDRHAETVGMDANTLLKTPLWRI